MKSQNPINDYVVNLHIYIRIIATRAGKNCAKKVRRGAADIFLEIVMQPFLGFDDIVPDSS
ncbi:hypothetical protein PMS19_09710, partial [Bifidobacterium longum]|nr:hypothetical protein [Bifidobacterium longum]MDB6803881.1 hypothetical protein [Bifidobacterium longum]